MDFKKIWAGIKAAVNEIFDVAEDSVSDAVKEAKVFIGTASDEIVAELKQTEIGTAVANMISAVDSEALSGLEKFEKVVEAASPLIVDFVQNGGFEAAIDDVEDIARQLVQSVFNDFRSTGFGKVVEALLVLLGLRK